MKNYFYIILAILLSQIAFGKMDIQFDPNKLDFGEIPSNGSNSLPVSLINKTTKGFVFQKYVVRDNYKNSFSVQINTPFEVPKQGGELKKLVITLDAPDDLEGSFEAKFIMFCEDVKDSIVLPLEFKIKKEDDLPTSSDLSIPALNYKVGESFRIPIKVDRFDGDALPSKFRALVTFNTSLCAFKNYSEIGKIEYGMQTKELVGNITKKPEQNDVFNLPEMIATLGDAKSTEIKLLDFVWMNDNNERLKVNNHIINGQLSISDISYDNPRLITAISSNLQIILVNNPNNSDIILKIKYNGIAKLEIFNILGIPAFDASNMLPSHTDTLTEQITIPRSAISNVGTYIIRLSTSSEFVSDIILIK